jgi:hypothetical protein
VGGRERWEDGRGGRTGEVGGRERWLDIKSQGVSYGGYLCEHMY